MSRTPGRHLKERRVPPRRGITRWLARLAAAVAITPVVLAVGLLVGTQVWAKLLHDRAHLVVVTSNSMQPAFSAGDLLAVKPVPPHSLREGQIVTIKRPTGTLVTHRIIEINNVGDQVLLTTKGDANRIPDPDVASSAQVFGVVDGILPRVGQPLAWVQSRIGKATLFALIILTFAAYEVARLWRGDRARSGTSDATAAVPVSARTS